MQVLNVPDEVTRQMIAHAWDAQPSEACGLLAGRGNRVVKVIPVTNEADDPEHFFQITQNTLNRHLPAIRADHLALIGFYHSHPRGLPYPSQQDVSDLAPFNITHVIIGLNGSQPRIAAWWIGQSGTQALELTHDMAQSPEVWTLPQKTAMIVSALISVLLLIALSLILLPPAP